jgi:tripartite ATP-independent transporter DctM subunit
MFVLLTWRISLYAANLASEGRTTIILGLPQAPFIYATTILLGLAAFVQLVVTLKLLGNALSQPSEGRFGMMDLAGWGVFAVCGCFLLALPFFAEPMARWVQDNPTSAVLIGFCLMWVLLLVLIPLAPAMAMIGLVGTALLIGGNPAYSAFATEATGFLTNYQVATLPLFLIMGSFAAIAGVSDDVYRLAQAVLGRFRGGLAMATIGGCAGFGAVTGSSLATVATFGRVSLPQMEARAYAPQFAAGCVAAGGTLGALIPPSGPFIIFALLTEASIGQLFIAAIIPGLIAVALYLLTIAIVVRRNPSLAPMQERSDSGEIRAALRRCGAVALLFGAVIGGMYSGVFTATEAAAVGAFGAFIIALLRGKLRASQFWHAMAETTSSTALIYTIIFGVLIFSFFVGVSAIPERATEFISGLQWKPLIIIALLLVCYLLLGCVMDSFTVMIVTVPIVTPVILSMGYDMVWWGVINLVVVELGLITPPFGLHLFVLKTMLPTTSLEKLYQGVLPFCAADFLKLALLVLFPILVLWLPSTMAP